MTVAITHTKVATLPNNPSREVSSDAWNESHTLNGLSSGAGAPSDLNGANGDFYLRSDGGALETIYQKRAGVWVGII